MTDVYIRFNDNPVTYTTDITESTINLDHANDGTLVGVEILDAKEIEIDGEKIPLTRRKYKLGALSAMASVRLTEEEYRVVQAAAARLGIGVSPFMRDAALRKVEEVLPDNG